VPKMKTRKAIKKRIKATATGKLKRSHPGKRHLLSSKNSKRKRHLRKASLVDKAFTKGYLVMIGKGKLIKKQTLINK
jgi:large subunit ribosomal protein L35